MKTLVAHTNTLVRRRIKVEKNTRKRAKKDSKWLKKTDYVATSYQSVAVCLTHLLEMRREIKCEKTFSFGADKDFSFPKLLIQ